jgi:hypothetical protein
MPKANIEASNERDEIEGRTPDTIFPAEDVPYIVQQHESGHRYRRNRN